MLTVYNVGQGDSFLINPLEGCNFAESPLLIDSGSSKAKVVDKISRDEISVLLTHSHTDHIGGMPAIFKNKAIKSLFLPYYLPEVVSISNFINKHTKKTKIGRLNWKKINSNDTVLVGEGDRLCRRHIMVLNPPKDPNSYFPPFVFNSTDGDNEDRDDRESNFDNITEALAYLSDLVADLPIDRIVNYETPLTNYRLAPNKENINERFPEYGSDAKTFVHQFFISLSNRIRSSLQRGIVNNKLQNVLNYYLNAHLSLAANQASVVFTYIHPMGKWLFTGDADEVVFERLISSKKDITSKYLKVPHHGSRENLSIQTLKKIAPEVAIISHENRKFGTSKDTHPHHETINLLDMLGVRSYYTNDVIKEGKVIIKKANSSVEKGHISFV